MGKEGAQGSAITQGRSMPGICAASLRHSHAIHCSHSAQPVQEEGRGGEGGAEWEGGRGVGEGEG